MGATAYGVPSVYIIQSLWLYVKWLFYFIFAVCSSVTFKTVYSFAGFALFGFVWLCLLCLLCLLCFKYLLCFARKYLKGSLLFEYYRISAMQITRFTKIVIFVTFLDFTFLSCIALLILYFCCSFACFVLAVRMRWGSFAPAGATTGFALWIPTSL